MACLPGSATITANFDYLRRSQMDSTAIAFPCYFSSFGCLNHRPLAAATFRHPFILRILASKYRTVIEGRPFRHRTSTTAHHHSSTNSTASIATTAFVTFAAGTSSVAEIDSLCLPRTLG